MASGVSTRMGSRFHVISWHTSERSLYLRLTPPARFYTSSASLCLSSTTERCLLAIDRFCAGSCVSTLCSSKSVYSFQIESQSAMDLPNELYTVEGDHHRFLEEAAKTSVGVVALRAVGGVAQVFLQELAVVPPERIAIDEEAHCVHGVLVHLFDLFWEKEGGNYFFEGFSELLADFALH